MIIPVRFRGTNFRKYILNDSWSLSLFNMENSYSSLSIYTDNIYRYDLTEHAFEFLDRMVIGGESRDE